MESKHTKRPEYLEDQIKNLKAILSELHQANVNLFNESEKLKQELKIHKQQQVFNFNSVNETINRVIELKELVEIKEIINQDLTKKYQQLEQDYNDLKDRLKIKSEVLSNLTAHTNELEYKYKELQSDYNDLSKNMVEGLKVTLQHRVKPYLSAGVVNVIIETKENFK